MAINKVEKIIKEIFSPLILDEEKNFDELQLRPTYQNLKEVAKLIADNSPEEKFQKYFAKNPNFLFRNIGASDDGFLGLIAKPKIGEKFIADFAIFTVGQGGAWITLIELETPNDKLFTQKLTPSKELQTAIGQIDDWCQWIEENKTYYTKNLFDKLKELPQYPEKSHNGSFKIGSAESIEVPWNAFGGQENTRIYTYIFIGRWANLTEKERKKLLHYNRSNSRFTHQIRTYDQIIRNSFDDQFRTY